MMTNFDLDQYKSLVEELKKAGISEALAKVVAYETLTKNQPETEEYSPFKTVNS